MDKAQFEAISKKLDALILLESIGALTNEDRLKILRHSVGIRSAAKILEKDPSNFKKSVKKRGKHAEEK